MVTGNTWTRQAFGRSAVLAVSQLDTSGASTTVVTGNTVTGTPGATGTDFFQSGVGIYVEVQNTNGVAPTVQNNSVQNARSEAFYVAAKHLIPAQLTGNTGTNNKINVLALTGGLDTDLANGLKLETYLFTALFATEDQKAGTASFIENGPGKAKFTGK